MPLIRPRLTDALGIAVSQEQVDFVIPFLDEDIPLYVDPFLLWKSPSLQESALHLAVVNAFNHLGHLTLSGREDEASQILIRASECREVGLGFGAKSTGRRIGKDLATEVLALFKQIPDLGKAGFVHIEAVQLLVDDISKDRISDFFCSFAKSFLIDYSVTQSKHLGIPLETVELYDVYDHRTHRFADSETVALPIHPVLRNPLLLVPKRWLRKVPWIGYDDYVASYYRSTILGDADAKLDRTKVLDFNRRNFGAVSTYVALKERQSVDCANDPLFRQIPILSAKRRFATIEKLPTGKTDNADREYETSTSQLLASLLYPELDFAQEQARTDTGVVIRDLIFYNTRSRPLLDDIFRTYDSQQIVFELKNVALIEREHINQLNRYLANEFGRFGVLVTRHPLSRAMERNIIDLWSGPRRFLLPLTDADLRLMVDLYESKQRPPLDVVNARYAEFTRKFPK